MNSGRRRRDVGFSSGHGAGGWSLAELSVVLAVAGLLLLGAAPSVVEQVRRQRLEGITRELATLLAAARFQAMTTGRTTGLAFSLLPGDDLTWTAVRDGNGDGLSSADLTAGVDEAIGPTQQLSQRAPGVEARILAAGTIPRPPPQTGTLSADEPALRFGRTALASFTPLGSARSGSLYLSDGTGMTALVVHGASGRLRLFTYNTNNSSWKELR